MQCSKNFQYFGLLRPCIHGRVLIQHERPSGVLIASTKDGRLNGFKKKKNTCVLYQYSALIERLSLSLALSAYPHDDDNDDDGTLTSVLEN